MPSSIGNLISLRQLNIPISFENLSVLESLDLSSNNLSGRIPTQLTTLYSLSKLSLSHDHLLGRIPGGPQFQTFANNSYIGNDGLCGIPLSRICVGDDIAYSHDLPLSSEQDDSYFMDGFSWKSVLIGYGVGIVSGLAIGWLVFFTGKPKLFIRFVEEEGGRIVMKRGKKKKISKSIVRKN